MPSQCNISNIVFSFFYAQDRDWCFLPPAKESNYHRMCPVLAELCFEDDYEIQLYALQFTRKYPQLRYT